MPDTAVFLNPITGRVESMPIAMIGAYVPHAEHLRLEEAARVAAVRDDEAATNLLLSVIEQTQPEVTMFQGVDEITAQPVEAHR